MLKNEKWVVFIKKYHTTSDKEIWYNYRECFEMPVVLSAIKVCKNVLLIGIMK